MPEQPQLIYLEPDDEITSVVRRLRAAEGGSVVIVAPGRSRATSSSVALRLLAQVAAEENRVLALVADPATRAVAGEAGIAAYASVAEATAGKAALEPAGVKPRAPIHVVRGLPEIAPLGAGLDRASPAAGRPGPSDETVAVRLPPPGARGSAPPGRRRRLLPAWPWVAGLLVVLAVAGAALLPGATVRITPVTVLVPARPYSLHLPISGRESNTLRVTHPGTATGVRLEQVAATGTVTFFNWNTVAIPVEKGTQVSAGGTIAFTTVERIVVPRGQFGPPANPGQRSVGVVAVVPGPTGNVAADAIDTVDDSSPRALLRGFPDNPNRLVRNQEATVGGAETSHPVIQQSDVDVVVTAIGTDLATQLGDQLAGKADRLYAGVPAGEAPVIDIPTDLVGREDNPTFELTGTLSFDRPYVMRADVEEGARTSLLNDPGAAPSGTTVLSSSIGVEIGTAAATSAEMTVQVSVRGAAAAAIDEAAARDRVAGLTVDEARAALADIGQVEVDLWPPWLDHLPRIPFRISVETVAPTPDASPSP